MTAARVEISSRHDPPRERRDAPKAGSRDVILDALRGIALVGIALENVVSDFRASPLEGVLSPDERTVPSVVTPVDAEIASLVTTCLEQKTMPLFALLFGAGLVMRREAARAKDPRHAAFALERGLLFLGAVGVLHMILLWRGDILLLYAVVGLAASRFVLAKARWLAAIGVALVVLHALPFPYPAPFADLEALRAYALESRHVLARGDLASVAALHVRYLRPTLLVLGREAPRTLGLFFMGAAIARTRAWEKPRAIVVAIVLGAAAFAVPLVGTLMAARLRAIVLTASSPLVALGYAGVVAAAFRWPHASRILSVFAPAGRMAFTNYLAQSAAFGAVFFGWGLSLYGALGGGAGALVGMGVASLEIAISYAWLRSYRFGPVEWLSRSFTYGLRLPMRRDDVG